MAELDAGQRAFLKMTTLTCGGLLIGFDLAACHRRDASYHLGSDGFSPNSWIHITPNDHVTLMLARSEMGPGAMTALQLAAEKAGWGQRLLAGSGHGLAVYTVYAGWVAHAVEVSVRKG